MRRTTLGRNALFAILLAFAAPIDAQIYRWTDATGRERFSAHLADVPEAQRPAALEAAQESGSTLSGFATSSPPASADRRGAAPPIEPRTAPDLPAASETYYGGRSQLSWRRSRERYTDWIASAQERLERCEARDAEKRLRSGLTALDACEAERSRLEHAEEELSSFEDIARSNGVPPGWLR